MLKLEPWRVYRPVVADSHHFDEEQDTFSRKMLNLQGLLDHS
jgi:hypothetical protein